MRVHNYVNYLHIHGHQLLNDSQRYKNRCSYHLYSCKTEYSQLYPQYIHQYLQLAVKVDVSFSSVSHEISGHTITCLSVICQIVPHIAGTCITSNSIRASLTTPVSTICTFINIHTGMFISCQLIASQASAKVTANFICAYLCTAINIFGTFINIYVLMRKCLAKR